MREKIGAEFDLDELDVEYEDRDDIIEYDGPVPKARMELPGRIKNMWWTTSSNGNRQFKVIFEAETAKVRGLEQYDGCPIWDQVTFTPGAAFRYQPFLHLFGLTLRDVKGRMDLEEDESKLGRKILAVGRWRPGSDEARCVVKTKTEVYEGERSVKIAKYLPLEGAADAEFDDDEDDFEEERRPRRREPATAGARSRSGSGPARSRRSVDDDDEDNPPF